MTDEAKADDDSIDLGTAAELLYEDGKTQAAALLADAEYRTEYIDTAFTLPLDDSDPIVLVAGIITVPRFLVERFTDEIVADVHGALSEASGDGISVQSVRIVGKVNRAAADWRETLLDRMVPRATNQASIGPKMTAPIVEDRCQFRSKEELRVYHALKRARAKCRPDDSFAIAPNAALVINDLATTEPDFLVAFRGRVGVVHVDGPSHAGRFGAEATRDRLYRQNGIAEIEHIVVEETASNDDLDAIVQSFLRRLVRR